jgi:uncharacterized membrane protein YjdF
MTGSIKQPKRFGHHRRSSSTGSQINPNTSWLNARGSWTVHICFVVSIKLFFSSLPGTTPEASWTLTLLSYNLITFFIFHWTLGAPFRFDQGDYDGLTLWEQIDDGQQFTPTRKFLTAVPTILFLLSTHYTHYDVPTFCINFISLVAVLIAKLPSMHRVRIFGINKLEQ